MSRKSNALPPNWKDVILEYIEKRKRLGLHKEYPDVDPRGATRRKEQEEKKGDQ